MNQQTIKEAMSLMGRKGGLASGEARMIKLTPEQRSEIARVAAKASAAVRTEKAAAKRKAESSSFPRAENLSGVTNTARPFG